MSIEAISPISPVLPTESTGDHRAPGFERPGQHPDPQHSKPTHGSAPSETSIDPAMAVDRLA